MKNPTQLYQTDNSQTEVANTENQDPRFHHETIPSPNEASHSEAAQNPPQRAQPKIIEQKRPQEAKAIGISSYMPPSTSNDSQPHMESNSMGAQKPM